MLFKCIYSLFFLFSWIVPMYARIGTSDLIYHHNDPFSNNASLMFSTNKLKVISTKVQNNLLKDTETEAFCRYFGEVNEALYIMNVLYQRSNDYSRPKRRRYR